MSALADFLVTQAGPRACREPGSHGPGPTAVPGAGGSRAVRGQAKTIRSWPLLVLAVPAAAEVWSGWVGIAQKTGFGVVPLLPGIWPSLHLDTAVTLPVGLECYAAYALRAWLAGGHAVSDRTRRFARWSAICSFALGMAGQVAFHLMDQEHITKAPWDITTLVSCLPVLVLGMGTALAHMLREDATAADQSDNRPGGPADARSEGWSAEEQSPDRPDRFRDRDHGPDQDQDQPEQGPDQQAGTRMTVQASPAPRTGAAALAPGSAPPYGAAERVVSSSPDWDGVQASLVALRLTTAGKPVSRRALRNGGVRGSNESLNALARQSTPNPPTSRPPSRRYPRPGSPAVAARPAEIRVSAC
jgi:hypothetical protein